MRKKDPPTYNALSVHLITKDNIKKKKFQTDWVKDILCVFYRIYELQKMVCILMENVTNQQETNVQR